MKRHQRSLLGLVILALTAVGFGVASPRIAAAQPPAQISVAAIRPSDEPPGDTPEGHYPTFDVIKTKLGRLDNGCTYRGTAALHNLLPPYHIFAFAVSTCDPSYNMALCVGVEDVDWGIWDSVHEQYPKRVRCITGRGTLITPPIAFNCIVGRRYKLTVSYWQAGAPGGNISGYSEGTKLMKCTRQGIK